MTVPLADVALEGRLSLVRSLDFCSRESMYRESWQTFDSKSNMLPL